MVYVSKKLLEAHPNLVCSNFCVAIRIKKNWNPLYIFYYIKRVYEQGLFFNFEGKTSGIKNLDVEAAYKAIPIEYRNRSEQDKSISLLTSIERKITVNRQINRNLRARREQRENLFSLCRADAVNGDVSRNLEATPDRSSEVAGVRRAA